MIYWLFIKLYWNMFLYKVGLKKKKEKRNDFIY